MRCAARWNNSQHSCPVVSWTHITTSFISLGSGTRCCPWKVDFGAGSFWQHPPSPRQLGAGGQRCASSRLGGRWLRSHVGCVGAAWDGRASLELGAWQGLPAKLPLTSGDGEQHSLRAASSSRTAVRPHPRRLDPQGKIQLHCSVLLLLSCLSQAGQKPHIHNVHMVVDKEGRLGRHCPKCISSGRL